MKFRSIFTNKNDARLWAIECPSSRKKSKKSDVLTELFRLLTDTEYLYNFFTDNIHDLSDPFWNGITIDEAITKVLDEVGSIEFELCSIELKTPGYEYSSLSDIFLPLHQNIYSINFNRDSYRKGKPNFYQPMVRIYAIELEDGTLIVTGGAIKLTKDMRGDLLVREKENLDLVRNFLDSEKIIDKSCLKEL